MNLYTKIAYLKLVNGEELISLILSPEKGATLEELFESGIANTVTCIYPLVVSTKRNTSFFGFWGKYTDSRTFPINPEHVIILSDTTPGIKEAYALFLKENGIDQKDVESEVLFVLNSLKNVIDAYRKDDIEDDLNESYEIPKNTVFH